MQQPAVSMQATKHPQVLVPHVSRQLVRLGIVVLEAVLVWVCNLLHKMLGPRAYRP